VVAFNEVLVGLANAKRWQDALALLVEMRSRFDGSNTDKCYDVTTFNTVSYHHIKPHKYVSKYIYQEKQFIRSFCLNNNNNKGNESVCSGWCPTGSL
jgi:pentatricopeptide repeat protein